MYGILHRIISAAFRFGFVLPISLFVLAFYYAAFPVAVMIDLATCDRFDDFKDNLYFSFAEMPARFFRELFTF